MVGDNFVHATAEAGEDSDVAAFAADFGEYTANEMCVRAGGSKNYLTFLLTFSFLARFPLISYTLFPKCV